MFSTTMTSSLTSSPSPPSPPNPLSKAMALPSTRRTSHTVLSTVLRSCGSRCDVRPISPRQPRTSQCTWLLKHKTPTIAFLGGMSATEGWVSSPKRRPHLWSTSRSTCRESACRRGTTGNVARVTRFLSSPSRGPRLTMSKRRSGKAILMHGADRGGRRREPEAIICTRIPCPV
jgi:hypothetical protein